MQKSNIIFPSKNHIKNYIFLHKNKFKKNLNKKKQFIRCKYKLFPIIFYQKNKYKFLNLKNKTNIFKFKRN